MRKLLAIGALFGLLTLVTSAQAQRPFGGLGGGGGGGIFLLMNKGVQEELKITEEQREKIGEKAKGMAGKFQEVFGKLKDVPEADRPEKMQKLMKEVNDTIMKEVGEALKPEQLKRFTQIQRQQSVAATLTTDEEAGKALDVTAEQKEKAKTIQEESTKEIGQLFRQFNKENPSETQEKVAAARKEANDKALKVLTDEQRTKWKDLVGATFEVKMDPFVPRKKKDN